MLQSFRGTINNGGIQTLRLERDEDFGRHTARAGVEFWAILNHEELPVIHATLAAGDGVRAWRLVCERAVWWGSVMA